MPIFQGSFATPAIVNASKSYSVSSEMVIQRTKVTILRHYDENLEQRYIVYACARSPIALSMPD